MPDDPITLTYEEYAEGGGLDAEAGYIAERSAEDAWPHFRGWRVNYEHIAYEIARQVDAVPALWSAAATGRYRKWHRNVRRIANRKYGERAEKPRKLERVPRSRVPAV